MTRTPSIRDVHQELSVVFAVDTEDVVTVATSRLEARRGFRSGLIADEPRLGGVIGHGDIRRQQ